MQVFVVMLCHYDNKREIVNFKVADISELKLNQCCSAGTEFLYATYSLYGYLHDENQPIFKGKALGTRLDEN